MASNVRPTDLSSYLPYLPAIFQENVEEDTPLFLGRFLLAFEEVLSGLDDANQLGIEEYLDGIATFFDPDYTPEEFLPWLASWIALTLRDDWSVSLKRYFLKNMVSLYKLRGTSAGLKRMLGAFTNLGANNADTVEIKEFDDKPYYFQVHMTVPPSFAADIEREKRRIQAVIDHEKPAHTYYDFYPHFVTMQIAVHSTIGQDTILGEPITTN
ncbi:MAG: phage tail protein I [Anaerolineaceae bacterium]|nr:phage tail protein I [Anaerolineaceae bacterium]